LGHLNESVPDLLPAGSSEKPVGRFVKSTDFFLSLPQFFSLAPPVGNIPGDGHSGRNLSALVTDRQGLYAVVLALIRFFEDRLFAVEGLPVELDLTVRNLIRE